MICDFDCSSVSKIKPESDKFIACGTPLRHGHNESYTDLNLKYSTSECDSNPRPHEY